MLWRPFYPRGRSLRAQVVPSVIVLIERLGEAVSGKVIGLSAAVVVVVVVRH
jgi:hypothetical protein